MGDWGPAAAGGPLFLALCGALGFFAMPMRLAAYAWVRSRRCAARFAFRSGVTSARGRGLEFGGSPTWARTRDLRINSPSLYRLSYRGIGSGLF